MKKYILLILLIILFITQNIYAKTTFNTVNIYFFHSNTCPHCKEEKKVLNEIKKQYNNVKIYQYEVNDESNKIIFEEVKKVYNIKTNGVPITIIGSKLYTGFNKEKSSIKFSKTIDYFSKYNYDDKVMKIINPNYISSYHESPYIKVPPLKEYMNNHNNFNLLGLKTDNLEPNTISVLVGFLSIINPIYFVSIIILNILLGKTIGLKNKLMIITIYFGSFLLLRLESLLKINILSLIIYLLMIITLMFFLIKYAHLKKRQYILIDISLILIIITEYIYSNIYGKDNLILKDIDKINLLDQFEKIAYYSSYYTSLILINITIILIIYLLFEKKRRNI